VAVVLIGLVEYLALVLHKEAVLAGLAIDPEFRPADDVE
jgi:hypothetical protein